MGHWQMYMIVYMYVESSHGTIHNDDSLRLSQAIILVIVSSPLSFVSQH